MLENDTFQVKYEPYVLIDESSDTEIYIGTSINTSNSSASTWQIKRVKKIGSVWSFKYPNGVQSFDFIWNERLNYSYE